MRNYKIKKSVHVLFVFLFAWSTAVIGADKPVTQILIKNVNIFDGKSEKLVLGRDVLIEANLIKKIGKGLKPMKMRLLSKAVVVH